MIAFALLLSNRKIFLNYFRFAGHDKRRKGVFDMIIDRIALILTIIGGINWGSVGLFKFDIVAWLCGGQTATVSRVIYTLVALSALWCISLLFRHDGMEDE